MAEMVGAELRLEAVGRATMGCGHDAGVGDHDVERSSVSQQRVPTGTDARQRREVELYQFEAPATRSLIANRSGCRFGLGKVPGCADDMRAVRREDTSR